MIPIEKFMKSSKITPKVVQKWSCSKGSRGLAEKSSTESDSLWFETFDIISLLFLGPLLTIKTLGQRSKKRAARGPPDFARRGPLGRRWFAPCSFKTIQTMHDDSWDVPGARAPGDFRHRGGDLRVFVVNFCVLGFLENCDFSCDKNHF